MKARIRFVVKPSFTEPNVLTCPGILTGRAFDRKMWLMNFVVEQQLDEVTFVGDLKWLISPVEQDFGKGVKFSMISDPKKYADGSSTLGMYASGELLG
jgi:hypothetical protein